MEKTTLYLPTDLAGQLRELSRRCGISQAELVRRAIREFLEAQGRPPLQSLGVVKSGKIRARDDEEWLRQHWRPR
jgi:Arc/MetJ-type ribon-helix-helix transcriptional regulator